MTNLQSGVSADQLSPQSFKNSQQNATFQDSGGSISQSGNLNQSVNTLKSSGNLQVKVNPVLGASTPTRGFNVQTSGKKADTQLPIGAISMLVVIVALIAFSAYFMRRYKRLATQEEQ